MVVARARPRRGRARARRGARARCSRCSAPAGSGSRRGGASGEAPAADDGAAAARAARAREGLRRGTEAGEARIARGLGEPALFAIALSAVGSSIYIVLGVVAGDALGLTPVVFLLAGAASSCVTMLTYVEGNSLHPERGGASTFARYAFDELWSFIAGWAIILDYLIVMAFAALSVPHYLAAFWGEAGDGRRGARDRRRGARLAWPW